MAVLTALLPPREDGGEGGGGGGTCGGARGKPRLQRLTLSANGIGAGGARLAARVLRCCAPTLRVLDLSGNDVGDAGATSVARAIASQRGLGGATARGGWGGGLRRLALRDNGITRRGAEALARALHPATGRGAGAGLEELDLSHNPLRGGGFNASGLASALRGHPMLRRLELRCCALGDEDAMALAEILLLGDGSGGSASGSTDGEAAGATLQSVAVDSNAWAGAAARQLEHALARRACC